MEKTVVSFSLLSGNFESSLFFYNRWSLFHQLVRHAHSLGNTERKKNKPNINSINLYMIRPLEEKVVDKFHKELRSDLKPATRPAGINFPVLINLVPITPDKTNDVAAKNIFYEQTLLN